MIYLELQQQGQRVNHKRIDRLYALEKLPQGVLIAPIRMHRLRKQ